MSGPGTFSRWGRAQGPSVRPNVGQELGVFPSSPTNPRSGRRSSSFCPFVFPSKAPIVNRLTGGRFFNVSPFSQHGNCQGHGGEKRQLNFCMSVTVAPYVFPGKSVGAGNSELGGPSGLVQQMAVS